MKLYFIMFLSFYGFQTLLSQQNDVTIKSTILTYVQSKNSSAELGNVFDIDTLLAHAFNGNLFLDNSNKLKDFVLFFALVEVDDDNFSEIGLYNKKDGAVKWVSDPVIGSNMGSVLSIQDLNQDGNPEIVTDWIMGATGAVSHIWILSWDGNNGKFLNDFDKMGFSAINAHARSFYIEDINSDKIMELIGDGDSSTVVFAWNGTKYTQSNISLPTNQQEFGKGNNFSMLLACKVDESPSIYIYSYSITNSPLSIQGINNLSIKSSVSDLKSTTNNEWKFGIVKAESLATFTTIFNATALIPGKIASSLNIESSGLPTISNFYAQGPHRTPIFDPNDIQSHMSDFINDIYNNSVQGYTISPKIWSGPINKTYFLDSLSNYTTQSRSLGWIKDDATTNKYLGYFTSAKTKLVQRDSVGARTVLLQVLHDVDIDSTASLSSEAYALLRFNTEYLVNILPQAQAAPFFAVKLVNSTGTKLTSGSLQYYDGSWKDAVNNNDGTFFVNTTAKTLSLRMTYEYGTQTKSNVTVGYDTVAFQTVKAQIQLQNSSGTLIDTGSVQYYAGAWRNLGTTINGTAAKELLPANYSFRMTYAYASKDQQQDISTNSTVVFQTVNAAVQLQNSQGSLMDQGMVQYYSGAWRDFSGTLNGVANKELLPNNYSFRMTYAYASNDKQQDLSINPTVVFKTVNSVVQLQNSKGALIDQGTVQYYSGAWRDMGTTTNGVANKELLPANYSFRMTYAYASKDQQQDISTNPTVVFQTVNTAVQLQNSGGVLMDTGTVQYYSGAWRTFGTTINGVANKELLPNSYSFRMTYAYVSVDKTQDISSNATVSFSTVLCTIRVKNSQSQLVDNALASYYSGAWKQIGNTVSGLITKELLPVNLSFRIKYGTQQIDKQQNLSTNNIVDFVIQ
ncbi:MAG: hypothetical protein ABSA44_04235 [Bacteroidota bacterium]|jgi:hypothetical protein